MASKQVLNVVQNDKLYDIEFTLTDNTGVAIDLTGNTQILFKAQLQTANVLKFSGAMTVVSAQAGTCKYTVQATNFDTAGVYYVEIEVTYNDGKVISFTDFLINVKGELPK